jgi:23S rRNA U2552 (ribose-2'-O)-methylase RlmE/FtsJ
MSHMNIAKYQRLRERVLKLMLANRPLWYRMDRAEVVSYRWYCLFTKGEIANPDSARLEAVEAYLIEKGAKRPKKSAA